MQPNIRSAHNLQICTATMLPSFVNFTVRNAALTCNLIRRHAGHSKWANIKHTKGLKDQQRNVIFTKLSRQIRVAIVEGGGFDPKFNLKLERVFDQCKRVNMPTATIQSVLKACQSDKSQAKSYVIEIKGPGSVAILLEAFTDNFHTFKQTTATILKKHKSKYMDGMKHLFEEKGIIETEVPKVDNVMDVATEHAIEAGAEDVKAIDNDQLQFVCGATCLQPVTKELENFKYQINSASVEYIPFNALELDDDALETCDSLFAKLGNLPEVVRIHHNIG